MSDDELILLLSYLQGWLDTHPESSLERQEIESTFELARATIVQRLTRSELLRTGQLGPAIASSILQGFLAGLNRPVDENAAIDATKAQLSTPSGLDKFNLGLLAGTVFGAAKSLKDNVVGLLLLATAATAFSMLQTFLLPALPVIYAGLSPETRAKIEKLSLSILSQLEGLVTEVITNPAFLADRAFELGAGLGLEAGDSVNSEYMAGGPYDKGEFVGEVLGYAIMEIALLFVGPEELLLKGGRFTGRGAAMVAEKVSVRTRRLLKSAPELMDKVGAYLSKIRSEVDEFFERLGPKLAYEGGHPGAIGKGREATELGPGRDEALLNALMEGKSGSTPGSGAPRAFEAETKGAEATGRAASRSGTPLLKARLVQTEESELAKAAEAMRFDGLKNGPRIDRNQNIGIIEYVDPKTGNVERFSAVGRPESHSEEQLLELLEEKLGADYAKHVKRIYTERAPCSNRCSPKLEAMLEKNDNIVVEFSYEKEMGAADAIAGKENAWALKHMPKLKRMKAVWEQLWRDVEIKP